jgi:dihydrofolate reductase
MTIKMIMAVDRGHAIGWSDGRLPWKLPADMKRFKELTTGCTVVMGLNTWLSLKRPAGLPNRRNVILTRKPYSEVRDHFSAAGRVFDVDVINNLDYVKEVSDRRASDQPTIWLIGGASVYEEAISKDIIDEFVITLVDADSGGDVKMTTDFTAWKLWLLREEKAGRNWMISKSDPVMDGEYYTSTLVITRISS